MKLIFRTAIALMSAAGATCMAAEPPRHTFECDTPAGHFSYWTQTLAGGQVEVTGKVSFNELRADKKWSPIVNVYLRDGKDRSVAYGMRFSALAKVQDFFVAKLLTPGGEEAIGGLGGVMPRTKEPVPFTLRLDAGGAMTVTVAASEAVAQLGTFKPATVELSCSTGDFEFTDVTITD
jgi:hypothetical protein